MQSPPLLTSGEDRAPQPPAPAGWSRGRPTSRRRSRAGVAGSMPLTKSARPETGDGGATTSIAMALLAKCRPIGAGRFPVRTVTSARARPSITIGDQHADRGVRPSSAGFQCSAPKARRQQPPDPRAERKRAASDCIRKPRKARAPRPPTGRGSPAAPAAAGGPGRERGLSLGGAPAAPARRPTGSRRGGRPRRRGRSRPPEAAGPNSVAGPRPCSSRAASTVPAASPAKARQVEEHAGRRGEPAGADGEGQDRADGEEPERRGEGGAEGRAPKRRAGRMPGRRRPRAAVRRGPGHAGRC